MSDLFEALTGLALLAPWALLGTFVVAAALWLRRRRGAPSAPFSPAAILEPTPGAALPGTWRTRLAPLPRVLQAAGVVLLLVALARPVRRSPLPPTTEGIDLLLCLDVSSSMTATDLDPERSRLALAKAAADRFIEGRPHDRIGLVCFARYPDVRCPPTLDHRALREFLAAVRLVPADSPEDATGIGTAVARSAQALRDGAARSKVVILLTDGEENVATAATPDEIAPLHAGQLCAELGVRVYAVAVGLGSRSRAGTWVEIDTRQVRRLAERTGGRYFEARDAEAVAGVYAAIHDLEKSTLAEPRYRNEDRFLAFLVAGVALLLLSRGLETTVFLVLP